MNKKQLVVAIACALCASVSPVSMADVYDVDITLDPINYQIDASIPGTFTGSGGNANLYVYDIFNSLSAGDVYIAATQTGTGTTTETGSININTDLGLDGTSNTLYFTAVDDININNIIARVDPYSSSAWLSFNSSAGAVNLNGFIVDAGNVTVQGELVIGTTGVYSMTETDSLIVDSITDNSGVDGGFYYTGGALTINSALNIDSTGLFGDGTGFSLESAHNLHTSSQNIGTAYPLSGVFTHNAGTNSVDGALTINTGGEYSMNGGNLSAGSIINNGSFAYTDGGVRLTGSDMTIASGELLGLSISIDSGEAFGAVNQNVGIDGLNPGTISQSGGSNSVDGILTINTGSEYIMNGGNLSAGTIVNDGSFTYTAGGLRLTNSDMTIASGELLGPAINIDSNEAFGAVNQIIGVDAANTGTVTHGFGTNTVDQTLTINSGSSYNQWAGSNTANTININAGGSYALHDGNLTVGNITRNPTGVFTYTSGQLNITSGTLAIETDGLLGNAVSIEDGQFLQTANQTVGTVAASSGSFTQNGGYNIVDGALTINAGGSYVLNNGVLSAGSIVNDGDMNVAGAFTIYEENSYTQSGNLTADSINADGSLEQTAGTTNVTNTISVSDTGSYTLSGGSLNAGDITRSAAGVFTYTGGDLTIRNGALAVEADGLLGDSVIIDSTQNLHTASQSVGVTGTPASGSLTQSGGTNTVDGVLTINDGGTYNLDGGNLSVASVANAGAFNFTAGGVNLTNSDLAVNSSTGLLGAGFSIDAGEVFGAINQIIGVDGFDTGAVTQTGGTNAVDLALTINEGSSYTQSGGENSSTTLTINSGGAYTQTGGTNTVASALNVNTGGSYDLASGQTLSVGNLVVDSSGAFSGAGTVNATGDIADQRTLGTVDASYNGANISLAADVMNGAIIASESISLNSITVNGDINGTAMALTGDSTLNGAVNLQPNVYNYSVINNVSGNNVIAGDVSIAPRLVDRVLAIETLDSAKIDVNADSLTISGNLDASQMNIGLNVAAGGTLALQGNSTAAKLTANVDAGGTLSLANTTTSNFIANGLGNYEINGLVTTGEASTTAGYVTLKDGSLTINGTSGAIETNGGAIVVGTENYSGNTAQLTIDYSSAATTNRIGDTTDIQLSSDTDFTVNGHATNSVIETAGSLIVGHQNDLFSGRDHVSNITVNGGGLTQLNFEDLQIATRYYSSDVDKVNRVNFSTNGAFGGNERIMFANAPVLVDGLLKNATINGQEFVTYNGSQGIKSATTATNSFVSGGNIFINSNTSLSSSTAVNSLAVGTANVTGSGDITLSSGQMLLSGTSAINPRINFGKYGQVLVTGNSTLAGGVNGSSGMFINGGGVLDIAAAGSMSNNVIVNSGDLILSADNALQGSDLYIYDGLDIGGTTQHVNKMNIHRYADFSSLATTNDAARGSVIATGYISDARWSGTIDANYQSLTGGVSVRADVMNGDINASTYANVGNNYESYGRTTMNGDITADTINVYGTVNGNMNAITEIDLLSSTINGVMSGTASLVGNGTLTNTNTYTGSTSGNFTLRGNGSIATTSDYTGLLTMYSDDLDSNVDRFGDNVQLTMDTTGQTLSMIGTGSEVTGLAMSETIGVINVAGSSEVNINIENSLNGTATLTADSLALGANSLVFLSLGDSSQLKFNTTPDTIGTTSVLGGIYVEKEVNGSFMPTWTTYDSMDGVVEVAVTESSIASASSGQFIRVTDAVNADLSANHIIGGLTVDTMQTMTGAGNLYIQTGQVQFWQDNTLDIAQVNFGNQQGFLSNAGSNIINSELAGTGGIRKLGEGKIVLAGANTYWGNTLISQGELEVTGSIVGAVENNSILTLKDGGSVGYVRHNNETVNLVNTDFTNAHTMNYNTYDYGIFNVDATSSLTNTGSMNDQSVRSSGVVINDGYIHSITNRENGDLTHNGTTGYISNDGHVVTGINSTVNDVYNFTMGTYVNNGRIVKASSSDDIYIRNYGVFINNNNISLAGDGGVYSGINYHFEDDELINHTGGRFTNSADKYITVSDHAVVSLGGDFNNEGTVRFQNTYHTQKISGAFVNNNTGLVTVNNSTIDLSGDFNNRGIVNVDANSNVVGTGTYRQQGNHDATTVVNGRIETSVEINQGELSGSGFIVGDLIVTSQGTVRPGNSPGLLTIAGDFTLEEGADLVLEIWGNSTSGFQFDQLSITGNYNLLGNVHFDLGAGVDVSVFDFTESVDSVFSLTDFFLNESGDVLDLGMFVDSNIQISSQFLDDTYLLDIALDENGEAVSSVRVVPVPAAVWLFGSGLIGLFGVARRRKAA